MMTKILKEIPSAHGWMDVVDGWMDGWMVGLFGLFGFNMSHGNLSVDGLQE